MAKVDLADGYYRVPLSPDAALALAVIIPTDLVADASSLVALPLTLPMGWTYSPPHFCAFTETIADMTNTASLDYDPHPLLTTTQLGEHLQHASFHPTATILGNAETLPLRYSDVYIDDFMVVAQHPFHTPTLNTLLHNIDRVFYDHPSSARRATISASKLAKGDAAFSTKKTLLGWTIDTHRMTLSLPPHRLASLTDTITAVMSRPRTC
jgi:hypothetical protein